MGYAIKSDMKLSIVYSRIENGKWTIPEFVSFTDMDYLYAYPFLSYDGNELYFTSNMPTNNPGLKDDYNFWVAKRKGDGWEEPVPLPLPINGRGNVSGLTISKSGTLYYTVISDKLIGALKEAGVSDDSIKQLLVYNPARAFTVGFH